jgi:ABC-type transporter Mla MlaB component
MKQQTENTRQTHHHNQTVAINFSSDRHECRVSGYINFKNVMKLRRDGQRLWTESPHSTLTVDLGGVEGSDNSGLVLLVAWLRDAREREKKLVYNNVPEFLQTMAQVFGLGSILFKTQVNHG